MKAFWHRRFSDPPLQPRSVWQYPLDQAVLGLPSPKVQPAWVGSSFSPIDRSLGRLDADRRFKAVLNHGVDPIYRFTLGDRQTLNLSLAGLNPAEVQLQLYAETGAGLTRLPDLVIDRDAWGLVARRQLRAGRYALHLHSLRPLHYQTPYRLTLSADALPSRDRPMPRAPLTTAENLGKLAPAVRFDGAIDAQNRTDYFRFQLEQFSMVNLAIDSAVVGSSFSVALIQDQNRDRQVQPTEILTSAGASYRSSVALNQGLPAGLYYLRLSQTQGDTPYSLNLNAIELSVPPDGAGNQLSQARRLGPLGYQQSYRDQVSLVDRDDYYRFSLSRSQQVNLTLDRLQADADLYLIQDRNQNGLLDTDEIIGSSTNTGATNELIYKQLPAGQYVALVNQYSGSTAYQLQIETSLPQPLPDNYDPAYGYGLIDASRAVAAARQTDRFPEVPDLGGLNWELDQIRAPEAWQQGYTGQGIVVAVVDTGVDVTHPDLQGQIWRNDREIAGNGIDDDRNGYIDDGQGWNFVGNNRNISDGYGHGTHVAGTIAAGKNEFGNTGVAYSAKIMPVRVLDDFGFGSNATIANGIRYAAANGADVINLSLGGPPARNIQAAIRQATRRGATVVMAAGNSYGDVPTAPANLADRWGLAVGAIDRQQRLAAFSNRSGYRLLNYVLAPGVNVYSAIPEDRYQFYDGTSMATPHVSGMIALMLSANPDLMPADVVAIVTSQARLENLAGKPEG